VGAEYRYGFNGMERDDEVKGSGASYDFGARMYDPRVGRWWSCDPMERTYPMIVPFAAFGANPINFIDSEGEIIVWHNDAFRDRMMKLRSVSTGLDIVLTLLERSYSQIDVYVDDSKFEDGKRVGGRFYQGTGDIYFPTSINKSSAFGDEFVQLYASMEEFFHALQFLYYAADKDDYYSGQSSNQIESEAKLAVTLFEIQMEGKYMDENGSISGGSVLSELFGEIEISNYLIGDSEKISPLFKEFLNEFKADGGYSGSLKELNPSVFNMVSDASRISDTYQIEIEKTTSFQTMEQKTKRDLYNKEETDGK
jgi:RHS repeat-associated protein